MKIKLILFLVFIFIGFFFLVFLKRNELRTTNFHTSIYYFDNQDFYSKALAPFKDLTPLDPTPRIFIVNQHLLAAPLIANQFALAKDSSVKRVILITQNNWNAGRSKIITSLYDWKTPLGNIKADLDYTTYLINEGVAVQEEPVFIQEHGISGIVPFIANAFLSAKITPLVIRDRTSNVAVDKLVNELSKLDLKETVIVASIDMSHYLPKYIADIHDDATMEAIEGFDYKELPFLDIDTTPTLRAIMKVTEKKNMMDFVVTNHLNSSTIVNDPDLLSTTSYITGYFQNGSVRAATSTRVLIIPNAPYDHQIERLFLGEDAIVGNLNSDSIQSLKSLDVTLPPVMVVKSVSLPFKRDGTLFWSFYLSVNEKGKEITPIPLIYKNNQIEFPKKGDIINMPKNNVLSSFMIDDIIKSLHL